MPRVSGPTAHLRPLWLHAGIFIGVVAEEEGGIMPQELLQFTSLQQYFPRCRRYQLQVFHGHGIDVLESLDALLDVGEELVDALV